MDTFKKVIWSEGMFLRPQHFQQQERYLDRMFHLRAQAPVNNYWGFRRLQLDSSGLSQGVISIVEAEGIFPDGTPFIFSAKDSPPQLVLRDIQYGQIVYLALPARKNQIEAVDFSPADQSLARYAVENVFTDDVNSVAAEPAELQLGQPRLRLLLESELTDSWIGLGILRITERRADGQLIIDHDYIPPVITVTASDTLSRLIKEILVLVQKRADLLSVRISQPGRGGVSEVGEFLMLQLLNRHEPLVAHALQGRGQSPEVIFLMLLSLCGELSTFAGETRRCSSLPIYVHDDLTKSFSGLAIILRTYLSNILEQNAVEIQLSERSYGVHLGRVSDPGLFNSCQFVLAVHANIPPEQLKQSFPMQCKIGSVDKIRDLVNLQLPGVLLNALPVAPRQIPYHAGSHYFELDKSSEMWKLIVGAGAIAMHVAGELPGLEIQCWAIRK